MEEITIKKVKREELDDLLFLIQLFTKEFVSKEKAIHVRNEYLNYLRNEKENAFISFVAYKKEKPIGCIQLFCYEHPPMLEHDSYLEGEMINFYVVKGERRKGYGQNLLDKFDEEVKNRSIKYVRLNSTLIAEKIYEKNGFKRPEFKVLTKWV
jgi:GNAT superfamily N-acetyltransferase